MIKIFENLNLQDLENEIWKDILDYEGDYKVSNIGRVKSLKFGKDRILKQIKNNNGYYIINLWKNGEKELKLVHRLVYETFKEKLEKGYVAHHINDAEKDNFIENLKSMPKEEHDNSKSEKTLKRMSESMKGKYTGKNNPNFKLTNQKIVDIEIDIKRRDLTQREMADKHGVCRMTVSKIKNKVLGYSTEMENNNE